MIKSCRWRPEACAPFQRQRGFTLLEMAIVIFIVGMLTAGLIGPVQIQLEARDRRSTLDTMARAAEALYGYALTHRRLPCPDTDGDGMSDPQFTLAGGGACDDQSGFLPWAELGVEGGDAWGNHLAYRVRERQFTFPAQNSACDGNTVQEFDLCAQGNITIATRGDNVATAGTTEGKFLFNAATADNVAAVIVSHGRNGYGATALDNVPRGAVPADNDDEAENADGNANFMSRAYTQSQSGCADDAGENTPLCEFDDLVLPVSRSLLVSRMVSAGQLP
jgi:prepilin-type N-terminal cleavage/methylation domain-containing protein